MAGDPIVFSASIGEGHDQAARALKYELEANGYKNVEIINTFYWLHPLLHVSVVYVYRLIIQFQPTIWKKIFHQSHSKKMITVYEWFISLLFIKRVCTFIKVKNPPFIVSTYPFATLLLSLMKEKTNDTVPLYNVITDFYIHPIYIHKQVTRSFTACDQAYVIAPKNGLCSKRFCETGIPFPAKVPDAMTVHSFREKLQVEPKTIVISGGGLGLSSYKHILEQMEHLSERVTIFCMTGHNKKAKIKLKQSNSKHDVRIIPFTSEFILYIAISDIIITKAGGLTISEAIACEVPLLLYESLLGHEEKNAEIAIRLGIAIQARNRTELLEKVIELLTDEKIKQSLVRRANYYKKPYASKEIVRIILSDQIDGVHVIE